VNHALIPVSCKIVDFIHPEYDAHLYGNIHIPQYRDETGQLTRAMILGHPVYESRPRLASLPAYNDPSELRNHCHNYVKERGGVSFFNNAKWRQVLFQLCHKYETISSVKTETYETDLEIEKEVLDEVDTSKKIIEAKLKKTVNHFCFPWFEGSELSARSLFEQGYQSVHIGLDKGFPLSKYHSYPTFISRIEEEYLLRLPGNGSVSLFNVFKNKLRK